MSFNKPSMNGLNNFDVDEIETLITNNTNNISTNTSAISNITSITPAQAQAIVDNSAKTGITEEQAQAISFNAMAIGNNTEDIELNTTSISNSSTRITNNATAITNNALAIHLNSLAIIDNSNNISNKQDEITSSNRLSATLIGDNGNVSNTEFGYLRLVTSDIQTQFTGKQIKLSATERLDAGFIGNGTVSDTEYNFLNGVESNIQTQISNNAQKITDMTYDSGASKTTFANDVHVSGALSTTNYTNLNTTVFNNILAIGTNATNISTNATDIATNATDIATNATDIATNTTDIGRNAANITTLQGGVSENDTNIATITNNIEGISTSSDVTTIDNQVVISRNATPQLVLQRPDNGGDIEFKMRGKRNGATSVRQAKIDLQNDDDGVINTLCSIAGRVTNHTSNIGGLEILNYANGQTATSALMMSPSGNFNIGGGTFFQDDCKVKITGAMYQTPQMTIYNFDKNVVSNDLWGNGNKQTNLIATRTIGTAFSSHSDGTITFSSTGTYKIKVAGNLQSRYNDRLAFAINLVKINSNGDLTNNFFENANYNLFSWLYSRNTSDGAHGNVSFEDYLQISTGNKIEIRNHLDINGIDFNDTLPESNLSLYLNMTITKITDNNIFA